MEGVITLELLAKSLLQLQTDYNRNDDDISEYPYKSG